MLPGAMMKETRIVPFHGSSEKQSKDQQFLIECRYQAQSAIHHVFINSAQRSTMNSALTDIKYWCAISQLFHFSVGAVCFVLNECSAFLFGLEPSLAKLFL
jgi:hypothetical protein